MADEPELIDYVGECLLWVIGVERALAPEPLKMTKAVYGTAAKVPKLIHNSLRAFVSEEPLPQSAKPASRPFSYKKARDLLLDPPSTRTAAGNVMDIDEREQLAFTTALARANQYLTNILPIRKRITATGETEIEPSPFETAKFSWSWISASDPTTILADLARGVLTHIQSRAFLGCFPTLYRVAERATFEALQNAKVAKKSFALPPLKERQLLVLFDKPVWSMALVNRLRQAFEQPIEASPGPPAGGSSPDMGAAKEQTRTQRIAAG